MTIQIDPDKVAEMLKADGIPFFPDDLRVQINNTNAQLARMPNFTQEELFDLLDILKEMLRSE